MNWYPRVRRVAKGLIVFLVAFLPAIAAQSDYLEVRRSATIKDQPVRDAVIVERPDVGRVLQLLDDGRQSNGYYRVLGPETRDPGWIYRTLVRRYRGNIPGTDVPATDSTGSDSLPPLSGDIMRAHFIDVGQGDATLLEFVCGAVLIDAGGQNNTTTAALIQYLTEFFARRTDLENTIDTVFVTHTHTDHNRALQNVVETFTVENYVHNGVPSGSGRHTAKWMVEHANDNGRQVNIRAISQTEIIPLPRTSAMTSEEIDPVACGGTDPVIRVLAGPYEENPGWSDGKFNNGNNKGLVIRIDFGEASFLFTGDLEEDAIETLADYYQGVETLDVDVYQVGHHGSHNGTTDSLMMAVTPEIAVISMGKSTDHAMWTAWAYGHPRRTIVDLLDGWIERPRTNAANVQVAAGSKSFFSYTLRDALYATGWDGTVVVSADSEGRFAVQTVRSGGAPVN